MMKSFSAFLAFALSFCAAPKMARADIVTQPDLRARPTLGDPSFMFTLKNKTTDGNKMITSYVPAPGWQAYTLCFWAAVEPLNDSGYGVFLKSFLSTEWGVSFSECGKYAPWENTDFVDEGFPHQLLELSAQGTWTKNCLPQAADYWVPPYSTMSNDCQYGCYSFNVLTDTPLTMTAGGAERQIAASNSMQVVTFQATTADRSVTIAADSPDAEISLGGCVAPLRQFFGEWLFFESSGGHSYLYNKTLTNEWAFVSVRAQILPGGDKLDIVQQAYHADGYEAITSTDSTNTIDLIRADGCFGDHSRIELYMFSNGEITMNVDSTNRPPKRSIWGAKLYGEWLADDIILQIRDQDAAEMQRRNMGRFVDFNNEEE